MVRGSTRSHFAAVLAAMAMPLAMCATARAADAALSEADTACLGCHAMEALAKSLPNGETLSLHVPAEPYARSVHRVLGCTTCHGDIDTAIHPAPGNDIQSLRQYSLDRSQACRMCHAGAAEHYEVSLHATRVAAGEPIAPVCSGCHGYHSVTPRTAYETCVRCHSADLAAHGEWLPNAGHHQEVVSCAACHAPAAPRMIDLRLYDGATGNWAIERDGARPFLELAAAADADGNGLDATELRNLLAEVNRDAPGPLTLRGRVELREDVLAHGLVAKEGAIRACDNCHRYGSEPFQNVTISITGPDGRPLRHPAQAGILGSTLAVESLPEFYAIGGTRSRFLDLLFLLALAGGIGVPIGHMTVKWLFRKQRARRGNSGR
ncbi:MAG TPA: multiheme c-type cytochrome [Steroidobacteraceae bacterium]|nr:multiheme c-type cytochrome [Steroidobacteraceae bacterium]